MLKYHLSDPENSRGIWKCNLAKEFLAVKHDVQVPCKFLGSVINHCWWHGFEDWSHSGGWLHCNSRLKKKLKAAPLAYWIIISYWVIMLENHFLWYYISKIRNHKIYVDFLELFDEFSAKLVGFLEPFVWYSSMLSRCTSVSGQRFIGGAHLVSSCWTFFLSGDGGKPHPSQRFNPTVWIDSLWKII